MGGALPLIACAPDAGPRSSPPRRRAAVFGATRGAGHSFVEWLSLPRSAFFLILIRVSEDAEAKMKDLCATGFVRSGRRCPQIPWLGALKLPMPASYYFRACSAGPAASCARGAGCWMRVWRAGAHAPVAHRGPALTATLARRIVRSIGARGLRWWSVVHRRCDGGAHICQHGFGVKGTCGVAIWETSFRFESPPREHAPRV
jgi:hypothetical protein